MFNRTRSLMSAIIAGLAGVAMPGVTIRVGDQSNEQPHPKRHAKDRNSASTPAPRRKGGWFGRSYNHIPQHIQIDRKLAAAAKRERRYAKRLSDCAAGGIRMVGA